MKRFNTKAILPIGLLLTLLIVNTQQFCYMFNLGNAANGPKVVTHTTNYSGAGGSTTIKVGINPSSSNLAAFRIPILNNILIWNLQIATQKNTKPLADSGLYDIESVALHEMGHALGLGHTNLASESGLGHPQSEATAAYKGSDGTFNVDPGSDGVYGSYDDNRGDDLNLNYFNPTNNPFILATPTDKSTYKSNISYLPSGHKFATTGGISESVSLVSKRDVSEYDDLNVINELAPVISYHSHPAEVEEEELVDEGQGVELGYQTICSETLLSHPDRQKRIRSGTTEAIMQQGTYGGEAQRTLSADDVAALYYARAGIDEIAGTSDDYNFNLVYAGESTGNNIDVYLDPSYTSVGVTSAGSKSLSGYHYTVSGATIRINPTISWYFNPLLATVIAFPSSQSQSIASNAVMSLDLYFASAGPSSVSTSDLTYTSSIGGSVSMSKVDSAHYTIQISGFSGSGSPCIKLSSTSLSDSKYSAKYEPSNQICFSVTSSGSQPSTAASVTPSPAAASPSPSISKSSAASNSPSVSKAASPITSPTPSKSPASSPSNAASNSPSASKSNAPSVSSAASNSPSVSKSNAASNTPTLSATKSIAPSPSSAASNSPSVSKSNAASNTPTASKSNAVSPSPATSPSKSPASSPSNAASISLSATKSIAPSSSNAASNSPSASKSNAASNTPTATKSNAVSSSPATSPSKSPASSPSNAASNTPTASKSNAASNSPSASKSNAPSVSSAASNSPSASKSNAASISATKSKVPSVSGASVSATKSPASNGNSPSPFPTSSPVTRHYGDSIITVVKIDCNSKITMDQCCTNFVGEWPRLSSKNTQALVKVQSCEANGDATKITYVQSGSETNTADSIILDYYSKAGCSNNAHATCHPSDGSLLSSSWTEVTSIQTTTSITYEYEELEYENANYYVVEEPLIYQKKRNMPHINNFEKEVEEYIRVAENSGSILAQSLFSAFIAFIALLF